MTRARRSSKAEVGLREGFRSGLEDKVGLLLVDKGYDFLYEGMTLPYLQPAKPRKYTPDFVLLHNGIVVETKGRFVTADRQKHKLIAEQYPALDLRFVFSNPNARISKTSKTTYAKWCDTLGFKYAKGDIPQAWLDEPLNAASMALIRVFLKEKK